MRVRAPAVQREVWRFLCHEALREAYWNAVDGNGTGAAGGELRIGGRLRRLAIRDEDVRLPF
jgi:hypothetical protein